LPRTLLVIVVPARTVEYLLKGEGSAYSLVHDCVQLLDDIKVDIITVVWKAGFVPWPIGSGRKML
jgi:soluble P-type ATPase